MAAQGAPPRGGGAWRHVACAAALPVRLRRCARHARCEVGAHACRWVCVLGSLPSQEEDQKHFAGFDFVSNKVFEEELTKAFESGAGGLGGLGGVSIT
jgi:hypothetical protein